MQLGVPKPCPGVRAAEEQETDGRRLHSLVKESGIEEALNWDRSDERGSEDSHTADGSLKVRGETEVRLG